MGALLWESSMSSYMLECGCTEYCAVHQQVFRRFLTFGDGPTDAVLVNNDEWLSPIK
jgi:hypothetical protein